MSAAEVIIEMGAAVALVGGKVKLSGLDRLPAEVAERVLAVARKRREELARELSGASAPGPVTGLDGVICPPAGDAEKYGSQWAAYDLADLCHLYGVRVARAGERVLAIFPPVLEPELIAYASELLAEALPFLTTNMDKLPVLEPAAAVETILAIMRQHDGLRFTRGEDGSRWPLFPSTWTAGQRVTLQALWFAAGDALDRDDFIMEETS